MFKKVNLIVKNKKNFKHNKEFNFNENHLTYSRGTP
jgi:hypothetical protein